MNGTGLFASRLKRTAPQWQEPSRCMVASGSSIASMMPPPEGRAYTGSMSTTAFVGGGNMASAIIGGLCRGGREPGTIVVVDPEPAQRERLARDFGVRVLARPDASLRDAALVVWAVKPQAFRSAAEPGRAVRRRRPAPQRDGRHPQRCDRAGRPAATAWCGRCRTRRR
jgi:hypothetical protein